MNFKTFVVQDNCFHLPSGCMFVFYLFGSSPLAPHPNLDDPLFFHLCVCQMTRHGPAMALCSHISFPLLTTGLFTPSPGSGSGTDNAGWPLYGYPTAAVTNYSKPSGLKQHKPILRFWRSGFQSRFHWVKIKVTVAQSHTKCSHRAALRDTPDNPFPCLFQLQDVAHFPWLMAPQHLNSYLHHHISLSDSDPSASLFQGPPWLHWVTQIIQDNLPIRRAPS